MHTDKEARTEVTLLSMFISPTTFVSWRSDQLDGAVVGLCVRTPGQTKVSVDRQRETTHEICCLAAELRIIL